MVLAEQIFEIETGKLLVKSHLEKLIGLGGYHLCFFVVAAAVAVVCLFVFLSCIFFLALLF